ncbi:GntR family transcriptional regulator [Paenibacillus durus]|uniref:GntR family transcriptional regulator n=1 Tax=Paenibacillus durus TaxID=44251 RepID=UPI003988780A
MPSTRTLAKTMLVGRNTVESAYQQLCSEGYVQSRIGSGYIVHKIELKSNNSPHNYFDYIIDSMI